MADGSDGENSFEPEKKEYPARLATLETRLREACEKYHATDPDQDPDGFHNQRLGIIKALFAFRDYAHSVELDPRVLQPLLAVTGAIWDVDQGIKNPLLERPKRTDADGLPKAGRPKGGPLDERVRKAAASAAVTALMKTGMSQDQSLKKVASHYGPKRLSPTELRNWRSKLLRRKQPQEADDTYWFFVQEAEKSYSPAFVAETIMELLGPKKAP